MKKLVVITGANGGFGYEMSKVFSNAGHPTLLIGYGDISNLEALNLENSIIENVDVTDYKNLESVIRKAEAKFGKTDLIVNNAGVMLLGNLWNQDPNEWQTMININVMGVMNGIQVVLKDMIEREEGTIINISSIAGIKAFPNHAAYCATKFGVHAITETLREEVSASNVRVLTIAPGAAETKLLTHTTSQEIIDGYNAWKETMGGVSLDPKQIANAAKYMYDLPQEVSVRELVIACTKQGA